MVFLGILEFWSRILGFLTHFLGYFQTQKKNTGIRLPPGNSSKLSKIVWHALFGGGCRAKTWIVTLFWKHHGSFYTNEPTTLYHSRLNSFTGYCYYRVSRNSVHPPHCEEDFLEHKIFVVTAQMFSKFLGKWKHIINCCFYQFNMLDCSTGGDLNNNETLRHRVHHHEYTLQSAA